MNKPVILVTLILFSLNAFSADVAVEACASAIVTSQSQPGVISGFSEQCINLSGSAVASGPGESASYADSEVLPLAWGGCNTSGEAVTYSIEFAWHYEITTNAGPDEFASGRVSYTLAPQPYISGSGTFSEVINDTMPDRLCIDGFLELEASAHARSGPLSTAVPGPGALVTLLAFLVLIFARRKELWGQSKLNGS